MTAIPDSWIDGLTLENIKLFVGTDPAAPFDWTTNAMQFHWIKNLKLKDIEIHWEEPAVDKWQSAITVEDAVGCGNRWLQRSTGLAGPRCAGH